MTSTLKLYGGIVLLVLLLLAGWGLLRWDSNRLAKEFEAGEMAERALWVTAQADANDKAHAKADAGTVTSEKVADQARSNASATLAASTAANQTSVEKIVYAYRNVPPVACLPDTQPLPSGVLEGLREARAAALGQGVTATGGLQSTQRQ